MDVLYEKEKKEFMLSRLQMVKDQLSKINPKMAERFNNAISAFEQNDKPWFLFAAIDDDDDIASRDDENTKSKLINALGDFFEHLYSTKVEYTCFHREENKMDVYLLNLRKNESIFFAAKATHIPEINKFRVSVFACYRHDIIDFITT